MVKKTYIVLLVRGRSRISFFFLLIFSFLWGGGGSPKEGAGVGGCSPILDLPQDIIVSQLCLLCV
jgi:hypothetical protein